MSGAAASRGAVDRLGERLRRPQEPSPEDLRALDAYRRTFRGEYAQVIGTLRRDLGLEVSGRPAKSTAAIVAKLRRGSMRLSQMQDVAGCRTIVPDVARQDDLVDRMRATFAVVEVDDRRVTPSHGYRAVHLIVRPDARAVEIQIRTELQHAWAQLSEMYADRFGVEVKYGAGDESAKLNLQRFSQEIAGIEGDEIAQRRRGDYDPDEFARRRELLRGLLRMFGQFARWNR